MSVRLRTQACGLSRGSLHSETLHATSPKQLGHSCVAQIEASHAPSRAPILRLRLLCTLLLIVLACSRDVYAQAAPSPALTLPDVASYPPPYNLLSRSIMLTTALFGQHLPSGGWTGPILVAPGEYGCVLDPLSHNISATAPRYPLAGAVVLVKNGGTCNSVIKAETMAKLGVRAVVMYNCAASEGCTQAKVWSAASDKRPIIPFTIMDNVPGVALRAALFAGLTVNVTLPGSGPMHPEDRQALTALYVSLGGGAPAGVKPWSFYNLNKAEDPTLADKSGGLLSWDSLFNASSDPCLQRLFGVTCVEGRVVQIQCANCGIPLPHALDPVIGNLTELTYLNFNLNNLVGPMPCTLGNLAKLDVLNLGFNALTSLTPCLGLVANITEITLTHNQLTGQLPAELLSFPRLRVLDVSMNGLSGDWPAIGVDALPLLITLLAGQNAFTGMAPSFVSKTRLVTADLSHNAFTSVSSGGFVNCPRLVTILLGSNSIAGQIPLLAALPALVSLDLSVNGFTGPPNLACGSGGADLQALTDINLAHNAFESPFTWLGCTRLATVRASANNFTSLTLTKVAGSSPQVGKFLSDVLPPSTVLADFSSNAALTGGWDSGLFGRLPVLKTLLLSGCGVTNLPSDLFTSGKYASIETLDLSSNSLVGGEMPGGTPAAALHLLRIDNNTRLVLVGALPTYFLLTDQLLPSTDGSYLCRTIEGPSSLVVRLSPEFHSYRFCQCALGFFPNPAPPHCTPFPTDVVLNTTSAGLVSDGNAGGRIRRGLDTTFYISPRQPSDWSDTNTAQSNKGALAPTAGRRLLVQGSDLTTPGIGVVSYALNFSYFNLRDADRDRLLLYSGLSTNQIPIYTFSEAYPPPPQLHVVAQELALYFTSYSDTGLHFVMNYTSLSTYPAGYLPEAYVLADSLGIIGWTLSCATILALVVLGSLFFYKRDTRLMVASSPPFIYLTILGGIMLNLAAILFLLDPSNSVCLARQWLGPIAFGVLLAPLLVKTNRIASIFNARTLRGNKPISSPELIVRIVVLMAPLFVLLVITSAVTSQRSTFQQPFVGELGNYTVPGCTEPTVLMHTTFAYLGLLAAYGSYLSYRIRNVPAVFNEGASLLNTIVALLIFGAIVFPLQLLVRRQPEAVFLLRCIGYILISWLACGILYVPKLLLLFSNIAAGTIVAAGGTAAGKTYLSEGDTPAKSLSPGEGKRAGTTLSPMHTGQQRSAVHFESGGAPYRSSAEDERLALAQRNAARQTRNSFFLAPASELQSHMPLHDAMGSHAMGSHAAGSFFPTPAMRDFAIPRRNSRTITKDEAHQTTPLADLTELLQGYYEAHPRLLAVSCASLDLPVPAQCGESMSTSSFAATDAWFAHAVAVLACKLSGEELPVLPTHADAASASEESSQQRAVLSSSSAARDEGVEKAAAAAAAVAATAPSSSAAAASVSTDALVRDDADSSPSPRDVAFADMLLPGAIAEEQEVTTDASSDAKSESDDKRGRLYLPRLPPSTDDVIARTP